MLEKSCELIIGVDQILVVKPNNSGIDSDNFPSFNNFCPFTDGGNDQKCSSYAELISSTFITLLQYLKTVNYGKENLGNEKFVQYCILWLCYKLNQQTENGISNLNDFQNNYINGIEEHIVKSASADGYNIYKNFIDKKHDSTSIDIKEMSKLYEALKILCNMYTECNKKSKNYTNCLQDAKNFAKNFENLNQDYSITGNSSYREILSSLSTDYNNFKSNCGGKCNCNDIPTLSKIKTPQNPVQISEATSSNSSIASKLIPGLLTFAIPIFLGVAYKYSLFGFGKRSQKQYLREKLKNQRRK
ncbi:CIR protein [Plasmodium chabaudi chabaudi]|uniref:CIR protein n=1 Tax=Plasmodium chabaudi chabaudi TaxID=31271 RepID=A0A1C6WP96_PLACU|nr:CIR protein [Plasmodium chabaudi chabaudi]